MLSEEKTQEIRKKLKKGYPQGELINDYLKLGYSEDEIRDAFLKLSNSKVNNKKTPDFPLLYVVSIGCIITGVSILNLFHDSTLGIFFLGFGIAAAIIQFIIKNNKQDN